MPSFGRAWRRDGRKGSSCDGNATRPSQGADGGAVAGNVFFKAVPGDFDAGCGNGQTALHHAAWAGSPAVIKRLLMGGSAPVQDVDGNLPRHVTTRTGSRPVAEILLGPSFQREELQLSDAATLRHHGRNEEAAKPLIERGASPNAKDYKFGWTPEHFAAMNGLHRMLELLRERGADMMAQDKYGWTPRHFACVSGQLKSVEMLPGEDINGFFIDPNRWTPLDCLAINGDQGR